MTPSRLICLALFAAFGCRSNPSTNTERTELAPEEPEAVASTVASSTPQVLAAAKAPEQSAVVPAVLAAVGRPAPDFTLQALDGKSVSLRDYRGKTVVLEWFNPGCPFVQKSHTVGSLVDAAARHAKRGVVWLAINSGAPGKQGHGKEANLAAQKAFKLEHPILLDEAGSVGRSYGAERTPHMVVIDAKGTLVYRGAVDNSPDGEKQSPAGGKLVAHVESALADLAAGRPVAVAETKAYGCSVKY